MLSPFGRAVHQFFSVEVAAVVGQTGGVEFVSPPANILQGMMVSYVAPSNVTGQLVGFRQALVLDTGLTVVAPNISSGGIPAGSLLIRTGLSSTGEVPTGTDFLLDTDALPRPTPFPKGNGIYLPPESILTCLADVTNVTFKANFGVTFYMNPPT